MSGSPAGPVVRDPRIMGGKPTIAGTRITIEQILRELAAGLSDAEILEAHPHLIVDDIRAAQLYAATIVDSERILAAE